MKKSIAIFFLLTFLTSVTGYSIELHYCKGKITDVAFFGTASCVCKEKNHQASSAVEESCDKHCHKLDKQIAPSHAEMTKKGCCKTEKISFASHKLKALSTTKISAVVQLVAILHPAYILKYIDLSDSEVPFYSDPLICEDLLRVTSVLRI